MVEPQNRLQWIARKIRFTNISLTLVGLTFTQVTKIIWEKQTLRGFHESKHDHAVMPIFCGQHLC